MPEGFSSKAAAIVDDLLGSLVPEGKDWQDLVRAYPVTSMALAAVGGFLVGRNHGPAIVKAISSFAAAEVTKNVSALLGQEVKL